MKDLQEPQSLLSEDPFTSNVTHVTPQRMLEKIFEHKRKISVIY